MKFHEIVKQFNEVEDTIDWLASTIELVQFHEFDEKWAYIDDCDDKHTTMEVIDILMERLYKQTHREFKKFVDPEAPTTWLTPNGYKECCEMMVDNIKYIEEFYLDWFKGNELEEYIDYLDTLYTDLYDFVEYYSKKPVAKFHHCIKDSFKPYNSEDFDGDDIDQIVDVLCDLLHNYKKSNRKVILTETFPEEAAIEMPF